MNDQINERFYLRDTGCSNGEDNAELPRHRWYVMKESFSPRVLGRASELLEFGGGVVLDPFSGSGTVPLAAKQLGFDGLGIEVNPFLAFVGKTKSLVATQRALEGKLLKVFSGIREGSSSPLEKLSTFSPGGGAAKWLFNRTVLQAFEGGWQSTAGLSPRFRHLIQLALIAAAMDTCNAVQDGKCLRYRKRWFENPYNRTDFTENFERRVQIISDDLATDPGRGAAKIINGDSRALLSRGVIPPFDLCITSPPYLNSFDYSDVYRPELFLGKFVGSNEGLRKIRLRTVRSHVQVEWERPTRNDFGDVYQQCIKRLISRRATLWSQKIPVMVQAYFEDMERMLRGLRECCRPGAKLWLVVSTSAYGGVEFPVDLILAEIGSRTGWFLREVGVLRYLRTSGQHTSRHADGSGSAPQLRESVVMLDSIRPAVRRRIAPNLH